MGTKPKLALDEAPLDPQTIDCFLSNLGPDMILVGG
ncbi:hypothetical protein AAW51_1001 [Caldimonas brevitalea]|uniref:Uncharacterized protein n=1 Tax=Caldimonas brevitalea TaxID=413882 RepID=A0A0G3BEE5_9BURK|nr:hypothetical protein AAW51_1001 [Caldimonas brevitalea]